MSAWHSLAGMVYSYVGTRIVTGRNSSTTENSPSVMMTVRTGAAPSGPQTEPMRASSAIGSTTCTAAVGRLMVSQQALVSPICSPLLKNVLVLLSPPYRMTFLLVYAVPVSYTGLLHDRSYAISSTRNVYVRSME